MKGPDQPKQLWQIMLKLKDKAYTTMGWKGEAPPVRHPEIMDREILDQTPWFPTLRSLVLAA